MAALGEAADPRAIPAHHQPITVMLDLVNPERAGRRSDHLRRQTWFDEAVGSLQDHGRRIGQQPRNHQLRAAAAGSLVQIDVVNRALYQFAQAIRVSRARSADRPAMYGPACTRLCPNPHTATEKALFVAFRSPSARWLSRMRLARSAQWWIDRKMAVPVACLSLRDELNTRTSFRRPEPSSPSGFLIVPARINLRALPTRRTVSASPPRTPLGFYR